MSTQKVGWRADTALLNIEKAYIHRKKYNRALIPLH
jgi:hypothetical protein